MRPEILKSLVAAVGALIPIAVLAEVAVAPEVDVFVQPTWDQFLAKGGLALGFIIVLTRLCREAFPTQLAPNPSTIESKRLVILVCIALGICFGLMGVAPAVTPGIAGKIVGGLGTGAIAFGVASVLPHKTRLDHLGRVGEQSIGGGSDPKPEDPKPEDPKPEA